MQISTALRFHPILVSMVIIKISKETQRQLSTNSGKDVRKKGYLFFVGQKVNLGRYGGNQDGSPQTWK